MVTNSEISDLKLLTMLSSRVEKLANSLKGLQKLSISKFIDKLPGYSAQVLTFGFMIGFLVVIAAVVIGIFIYVLTMQKIAIFGVMKSFREFPVALLVILSLLKLLFSAFSVVLIGLLATLGSALILPGSYSFSNKSPLLFGVITLLMIVVAIVGALFSVRAIFSKLIH